MRCYTTPHQCSCGIDWHARSMDVCIPNQAGDLVAHRHLKTKPDALLQIMVPSREDSVVAVDCLCTWSWLADLCAQEGMAFVLGHALSMKAIHGGQGHERYA